MLDVFMTMVLAILALLGLRHPLIAFGGYMWADIVAPQYIVSGFAGSIPYSNVLAVITLLSLGINRKRLTRPTSIYVFVTLIVFLYWTTVTHSWAQFPYQALFKLEWITKSLGFMLVTLIIVNSKQTIEYFIMIFTACTAYFSFSAGIKTLAGGGGYGAALVHASTNNGLAESSTLAGVSVACLPFLLFFSRHSSIFPRTPYFILGCYVSIFIFVVAVFGTFARTGLVCLFVLFMFAFAMSKRKAMLVFLASVTMVGMVAVAGDSWLDRMGTILDDDDVFEPIVSRKEVFQWTFYYSLENPLGGGMDAYLANAGQLTYYSKHENVKPQPEALAFHNIFFEILGEQGYPGLILYLSILGLTIRRLFRLRKPESWQGCDNDTTNWATNLSMATLASLLCIIATGLFTGIAYRIYLFIPVIATCGLSYINRQYLVSYVRDKQITTY